ncbi:MAG: acyltransferase [Bacteroidetes bacterium]|nr:acyltransferase [Bacteroidota bacterium]
MLLKLKFIDFILRVILKVLPLIAFPKVNVWLYRKLGFDLHHTVRIYSSVQIFGNINVKIGAGTFLGHETLITGGQASIAIGENCDISDRVNIICGTHEIDSEGVRSAGKGLGKNITIGNGVWIGFGSIILPGITIGDKSIVAAGTVVHKNVHPRTIVGGNPMKIIRKLDDNG